MCSSRCYVESRAVADSGDRRGVISSVSSTLSFGLAGGGHVGMVWGWFVPGAFVICIALSMAELASAMPTSGGVSFSSSSLLPRRSSPVVVLAT